MRVWVVRVWAVRVWAVRECVVRVLAVREYCPQVLLVSIYMRFLLTCVPLAALRAITHHMHPHNAAAVPHTPHHAGNSADELGSTRSAAWSQPPRNLRCGGHDVRRRACSSVQLVCIPPPPGRQTLSSST